MRTGVVTPARHAVDWVFQNLPEQVGPGDAVGPGGLLCRLHASWLLRGPRPILRHRHRWDRLRRGGHDARARLGVRREHFVIPETVNARRRHQRCQAGKQFVWREHQQERPAARALHPVHQLSLLALREALQRQRRAQRIAAEPLPSLTIVLVDPDARVEREAVEGGAVPAVPEFVGEPLAISGRIARKPCRARSPVPHSARLPPRGTTRCCWACPRRATSRSSWCSCRNNPFGRSPPQG
jgi:hypothetical protein